MGIRGAYYAYGLRRVNDAASDCAKTRTFPGKKTVRRPTAELVLG